MDESKKILVSGRLSGTRTFISELEKIENPDEIEQFLLEFSKLKISVTSSNKIKYINDDQDLLEIIEYLHQNTFIGLFHTENFSRLYIATSSQETFIIRLNKVSPAIIGTLISKEKPVKFAINSFNFIKWCNNNSIEIKNLLDIPTYIKLLTNDVDPFRKIENYFLKYTDYEWDENDNEKNYIFLSQFIYQFGLILANYIEKFDLTMVNKLINENSYYEGNTFNNTGNCTITLSYLNVKEAITNISSEILEKFQNKAYFISPLNRIAPTFKQSITELIYEVYAEDLSIAILNELYNNNIPVKFNDQNNKYIITCKSKNFSSVITLLQAIFSDAFYTLFEQTPEIHIECLIKD